MMHSHRRFVVTTDDYADRLDELAAKLTEFDWCGCNGFRVGDYLLLNDSTSGDGAQEYAVLKVEGIADGWTAVRQIESITFGWMKAPKALESLRRIVAGDWDHERYALHNLRVQTPAEHGCCAHCT